MPVEDTRSLFGAVEVMDYAEFRRSNLFIQLQKDALAQIDHSSIVGGQYNPQRETPYDPNAAAVPGTAPMEMLPWYQRKMAPTLGVATQPASSPATFLDALIDALKRLVPAGFSQ